VDNKLVSFPNITVKVIYNSILQAQPFTNKAIEKWSTHFNEPIYWHDMIKNINRGRLLENKTKEKLYKIHTRALPVGRKMSGPNAATSCPFCSIYEDEMHCFIICKRLESLWKYVKTMLIPTCRWISALSDKEQLFGYVHSQRSNPLFHVWKIVHAETIRLTWYSRCRKLYVNEVMHYEELKGRVNFRIQSTLEASEFKGKVSQLRFWKLALPHEVKNGRLKLNFPSDLYRLFNTSEF
jgi:hypothetical protein